MASAPSSSSLKDVCPKNARRCSKSFGHRGPCNKDRQLHRFWERIPIIIQKNIEKLQEEKENIGKKCGV